MNMRTRSTNPTRDDVNGSPIFQVRILLSYLAGYVLGIDSNFAVDESQFGCPVLGGITNALNFDNASNCSGGDVGVDCVEENLLTEFEGKSEEGRSGCFGCCFLRGVWRWRGHCGYG